MINAHRSQYHGLPTGAAIHTRHAGTGSPYPAARSTGVAATTHHLLAAARGWSRSLSIAAVLYYYGDFIIAGLQQCQASYLGSTFTVSHPPHSLPVLSFQCNPTLKKTDPCKVLPATPGPLGSNIILVSLTSVSVIRPRAHNPINVAHYCITNSLGPHTQHPPKTFRSAPH